MLGSERCIVEVLLSDFVRLLSHMACAVESAGVLGGPADQLVTLAIRVRRGVIVLVVGAHEVRRQRIDRLAGEVIAIDAAAVCREGPTSRNREGALGSIRIEVQGQAVGVRLVVEVQHQAITVACHACDNAGIGGYPIGVSRCPVSCRTQQAIAVGVTHDVLVECMPFGGAVVPGV